jgi:hypothetical protein
MGVKLGHLTTCTVCGGPCPKGVHDEKLEQVRTEAILRTAHDPLTCPCCQHLGRVRTEAHDAAIDAVQALVKRMLVEPGFIQYGFNYASLQRRIEGLKR